MGDDAAGKRLVRVSTKVEVRPEGFRYLREVVLRRLDRRETTRALDSILAGRKPSLRQQRCRVAILRGPSRMERLRHGAEHLAKSGCLRGCQTQRPDHFLDREPQQFSD